MINDLKELIKAELGEKDSKVVLDAIDSLDSPITLANGPMSLQKDKVQRGRTRGDWAIGFPYALQDIRPATALGYTTIKEMLKSGVIRFAVDTKRAQMVSAFANKRRTKVSSSDEEMSEFGKAVMDRILPQMAYEFIWSALVYGSAFMELTWEVVLAKQLGLQGNTLYTVPKVPNLVPHETIRHIRRNKNGSFNGFTQIADDAYITEASQRLSIEGDIVVKADSALVIPYNGFSRNLWGESFLKPIYPLWFFYEIILRAAVQFAQMMGDPPKIGKAPSRKKIRLSSTSELVDAIDYLLAAAANLPKTNAVILPSDSDEQGKPEWELAYMQLPDRSQPFVQIIEQFNKLILRASLNDDISGTTKDSAEIKSQASSLHNDMVINSWLHFINTYFMPHISKLNRGENAPPLTLELQALDPREREFMTNIMKIAGNSSTFQDFFYRVDWETLGLMSGIPMLDEEQAGQLKQKLQEESLKNQEDQLSMAKKFESPNAPADNKGTNKPVKDTDEKLNEKLEELANADKLPIFFSNDELKNFVLTEEEKKKLYTGYSDNSKAAAAVAAAYLKKKDGSIQLFNPYHDKLGRFTTAAKAAKRSASAVNSSEQAKVMKSIGRAQAVKSLTKTAPGPVRWIARRTVGSKNAQRQKIIDKERLSDVEYKNKHQALPGYAKDLVANPAEALTRKGSKHASMTNFSLELGSDIAIRSLVRASIYGTAHALGGIATATILTSVFGSAPLWAVSIGGVAAGVGSTMVMSSILDHGTSQLFYGVLDRKAPKDKDHIMMSGITGAKRKAKSRAIVNTGVLAPVVVGGPFAAAGSIIGEVGATGIDAFNFGISAGIIEFESASREEYDKNETARALSALLYPFVVDLLIYDDAPLVVIPTKDIRLESFGFKYADDKMFMDKDGALVFAKNWSTGGFVNIDGIGWGNADAIIDTSPENKERQLEIKLANPYHDELGRFTTAAKATRLFGGSSNEATPAQVRKTQLVVGQQKTRIGAKVSNTKFKNVDVSVCDTWKCAKKESGFGDRRWAGMYVPNKKKVIISPAGSNLNKSHREYVVTHELLHTRERSKKGRIKDTFVEEGATQLLTHAVTGKRPNSKTPYQNEMHMVAETARHTSGGDRKKAWKVVNEMHYRNDTSFGAALIDKTQRESNLDLTALGWMFDDVPLTLEQTEEEFFDGFEKQEEFIYKKVRDKTKTVVTEEDVANAENILNEIIN